jgi:hypothetical protein
MDPHTNFVISILDLYVCKILESLGLGSSILCLSKIITTSKIKSSYKKDMFECVKP